MTYAAQLTITANSAIDTAAICYRKARKDCYRIHAMLTHPRTVQAAKIAVWCLYLGAVVAFALGQAARILVDAGAKAVQQWAEAEVQSCLPADHVPDAGKMVEADPFSPAENQHYPAMAATIAQPVAVAVVKVATVQPRQYSIRELKRMASEAKVKGYSTMTKARLMEVLALA